MKKFNNFVKFIVFLIKQKFFSLQIPKISFFYQWRNAAPALAHDVLSWMANSERTEPPHIVFTYMADRLDSSHRDIANQKRAGMNIHSSAVKRLHMLQVLFAWQVANKVVKQSVTTSAGYSRCLNKWMGSQTTDSWVFA